MNTDETPLIDGCFSVMEQKWGTWVSESKDGEKLITSTTCALCVDATRWYLKQRQERFTDSVSTYDGQGNGKP